MAVPCVRADVPVATPEALALRNRTSACRQSRYGRAMLGTSTDRVAASEGGQRAAPQRDAAVRRRWSATAVWLVACLALVFGVFHRTWFDLVGVWGSTESYAHGHLVIPIVLWLCWRLRRRIAATVPRFGPLGLVAMCGACVLWVLAQLASVDLVAYVAVVAMVPAAVVTVLGGASSRVIAFPLAFLLFMIPFGEGLVPLLVDMTADATVFALRASGLPVYRDGVYFSLPTGNWEIEDGCSGLRYVIAAFVLSTLFAYLNFRSPLRRLAFIAFALAVSVAANWLRAYLIVLIGHFSGMRYGVGDDHLWYGWVLFGVVIYVVFWAGRRWGDPSPEPAVEVSTPEAGARPSPGADRRVLAVLAFAGACWAAVAVVDGASGVEPRAGFESAIAAAIGPAAGGPISLGTAFVGADGVAQGRLDDGAGGEFYAAYFAGQGRGRELVSVTQAIVDRTGGRWRVDSSEVRRAGLPGDEWPVVELAIRDARGDRRRLWYWYSVDGVAQSSGTRTKLATLVSKLVHGEDHATIAIVSTVDGGTPEEARTRLARSATALRDVASRYSRP